LGSFVGGFIIGSPLSVAGGGAGGSGAGIGRAGGVYASANSIVFSVSRSAISCATSLPLRLTTRVRFVRGGGERRVRFVPGKRGVSALYLARTGGLEGGQNLRLRTCAPASSAASIARAASLRPAAPPNSSASASSAVASAAARSASMDTVTVTRIDCTPCPGSSTVHCPPLPTLSSLPCRHCGRRKCI
jgi:hypothetical protein